jgi:hypothetical protein
VVTFIPVEKETWYKFIPWIPWRLRKISASLAPPPRPSLALL